MERHKNLEEGVKVKKSRDYKRMLKMKNWKEELKSKAALLAAKLEMRQIKETHKQGLRVGHT